jgi:hypothetical protein
MFLFELKYSNTLLRTSSGIALNCVVNAAVAGTIVSSFSSY